MDEPTRRCWGIGYPRISELSGVPEGTVRQAVRRGQLDPGDPLALADWIRAQRVKAMVDRWPPRNRSRVRSAT